MKRLRPYLTYFFVLLFLRVQVGAITINQPVNSSDIGSTSSDDIVLQTGAVVTVNSNVVARSFTIQGGTWNSTGGHSLTAQGFAQSGGVWNLGPGDVVEGSNTNVLGTHEFNLTGGTQNWIGTVNDSVRIRCNYGIGRGSVMFSGNTPQTNLDYVKFSNFEDFQGTSYTGGVNFQSVTTPSTKSILHCSFDSASLAIYSCNGLVVNHGRIQTEGTGVGIKIFGGTQVEVRDYKIFTRNNHGIYTTTTRFLFSADTITELNTSGVGSYGVYAQGPTVIGGGKIEYSQISNYFANIGIATNSRYDSLFVYRSRVLGSSNSHTMFLLGLTKGTRIYGSELFSGSTRGTLVTYDGSVVEDLKLYYNTIGHWTIADKAPLSFDCTAGSGCNGVVTGLDMVGNLLFGKNAGFGYADIWVSGGYNVQVTRFINNALDIIDTTSVNGGTNRHFAVPGGSWPSTNLVTSNFGFVDSINGNFMPDATKNSQLINHGETSVFELVYGSQYSSTSPGDIGAIQTFSGGSGPAVNITIGDPTVTEGAIANVVFTASTAPTEDVVINYSTASAPSNSATSGSDYTPVSGTATIYAGTLTATVQIQTIDDAVVEGQELFRLNASITSPPPNVNLAETYGVITLNDNDTPASPRAGYLSGTPR